VLRGADYGTDPASPSRLQAQGGNSLVHRLLARMAVVTAVFISFAAAGLLTVRDAESAGTRLDPTNGVLVGKIERYQRATWGWQRLMGVPKTPNRRRYLRTRNLEYRLHILHQWRRRSVRAKRRAHNPPHEQQWRCLQRYEGSWRDAHDPYWGGLQMDKSFMKLYAPRHLLRRGWANRWSPIEQMWVAERALRAGRGFHPWPHTARMCGLI
jgi:hypothetical protein